jgi:hypothetical protein
MAMVAVGFAAVPSAAKADMNVTITTSEVVAALSATDAADGSLVADPATSRSDSDSAAVSGTGQEAVDVSKDPSAGVDLGAPDAPAVNVGLPNGADDSSGKRASDGAVVYTSNDGTANAVIPTNNGVQMLTVIGDSNAPTSYTYPVDIPSGGSVQLFNGGAVVEDAAGNDLFVIPAPWARDANGVNVPTHFETDGTSLTQVVDHSSGGYEYPIVADPSLWRIAKCTAAITWLVASSVTGLRAIRALGGVTMAVRLLIAAGSLDERIRAIAGSAAWILGISQVRDNCF